MRVGMHSNNICHFCSSPDVSVEQLGNNDFYNSCSQCGAILRQRDERVQTSFHTTFYEAPIHVVSSCDENAFKFSEDEIPDNPLDTPHFVTGISLLHTADYALDTCSISQPLFADLEEFERTLDSPIKNAEHQNDLINPIIGYSVLDNLILLSGHYSLRHQTSSVFRKCLSAVAGSPPLMDSKSNLGILASAVFYYCGEKRGIFSSPQDVIKIIRTMPDGFIACIEEKDIVQYKRWIAQVACSALEGDLQDHLLRVFHMLQLPDKVCRLTSTISNSVCRKQIFLSNTTAEIGAACLYLALCIHKYSVSIEEFSERVGVSADTLGTMDAEIRPMWKYLISSNDGSRQESTTALPHLPGWNAPKQYDIKGNLISGIVPVLPAPEITVGHIHNPRRDGVQVVFPFPWEYRQKRRKRILKGGTKSIPPLVPSHKQYKLPRLIG